ncbi:MAG: PKD domain-containing protein [Halobacteriota archaeon]
MKRTLVIAILCMLLFATAGSTAATAGKEGKTVVYRLDVTSGGTTVGKLTVDARNPSAPTYSLTGKGLAPSKTYYLCDASLHVVGSGVTNSRGTLQMAGAFPTTIDLTNAAFHLVMNFPPTADFSVAFDSTGLIATCTDKSTDPIDHGGIASWSWTFGDGSSSTDQNPTHRYLQEGTFTVTLTVTDSDGGLTATISKPVTVSAAENIRLYDVWDEGDGFSPSSSLAGTFTLDLTTGHFFLDMKHVFPGGVILIANNPQAPSQGVYSWWPSGSTSFRIDPQNSETNYEGTLSGSDIGWLRSWGDGATFIGVALVSFEQPCDGTCFGQI